VFDSHYNIANFNVSARHPTANVPVLYWRSVGHTHNAHVMETLIDELAMRAKVDPIAYRYKLLKRDAKKPLATLKLLEEKATWRSDGARLTRQ
jgi:isoquinoline 1-oxidoreductase beta subunit